MHPAVTDRYTPATPGSATCPHCEVHVGAPSVDQCSAVRVAFLTLACLQGHAWYEVRTPDEVSRHWTPMPLPVGSGG